jgi:single-stranded-DNA-specific exonuclease
MTDDLNSLCKQAAELILSFPKNTRIRVVSHYDADGISAAGIICQMLYRQGSDFHATLMRNPFTKGFERLQKENNELIIFCDMGSGQLETIEQLKTHVIIVDHHQPLSAETSEKILQINANLCGINGNYEASGASLCFSLATVLNPLNSDLAWLALAGAIGDKQYIGGIRGYNDSILQQAVQQGVIKEIMSIKLYGENIADALFYSIDPFFSKISGDKEGTSKVLEKLGIDPLKKIEEIPEETWMRLQSFLLFTLIKHGCDTLIIDTVIRKRYVSTINGYELERFADLLDACGKNGHRSLGLSLCLGNTQAYTQAYEIEKEYKTKILTGLTTLENGGIHEQQGMRYFYSESSSLGGVIAGIATNFLFDESKALFSITRNEDELHISCRGTQKLVEQGLDLGGAMNQVAKTLNGYGGGHKIAAGATIALDKEKEFLEQVDALLVTQLRKKQ